MWANTYIAHGIYISPPIHNDIIIVGQHAFPKCRVPSADTAPVAYVLLGPLVYSEYI